MAMTTAEFENAMASIGSAGESVLQLRSEELQERHRVKKMKRLKTALRKKSKLLLETEIALPFDPETGLASPDTFNSSRKYRPPFSATTVALYLKKKAHTNENLKNTLMKRAGYTEWDTSDFETLTDDDKVIFGKYRVPRIFSLTVTSINIPAMKTDSSNAFAEDYAVSVKRDEFDNVIGETPLFILANKFFRDRAFEEVQDYKESIKNANPPVDDKTVKQQISTINAKNPVSDDHPKNFVRLFEFPMDDKLQIPASDFASVTVDTIKNFEVISNYKADLRKSIDKYMEGSWSIADVNFDFFEIDMNCPIKGDDSTLSGKGKITQDTTWDRPNPIAPNIYDGETVKVFLNAVRSYIDSDAKLDTKIRASMNVPVMTEDIENRLFRALPTVIDLDSDRFITQEVIKKNSEFIRLIFGDEGDEIVDDVEAGVSDKDAGSLDESAAKKMAKEYDLTSAEFNEPDKFPEAPAQEGTPATAPEGTPATAPSAAATAPAPEGAPASAVAAANAFVTTPAPTPVAAPAVEEFPELNDIDLSIS